MDEYVMGEAKSIGALKAAFSAKKVGWYIYMIGERSYGTFGKGAKPDTKLLKTFTEGAKQQKGKVFRGAFLKVGAANPTFVVQPAGTSPPLAKFYGDMKALASKSGVIDRLPKSAAELLFNAKIHGAPAEEEEEEEAEQQDADASQIDSGKDDKPSSVPDSVLSPEDDGKISAFKSDIQDLFKNVTDDYEDVMTTVAKLDELSPEAEADLGLFSEIYAQIEKLAKPSALDKVQVAKITRYRNNIGELADQLAQNRSFVKRQGWFLGGVKVDLSSNDKKANEKLLKELKTLFKELNQGYEDVMNVIIDDPGREKVATDLYKAFVRVEALLAPATKTLKFTQADRDKYQQRVDREVNTFRRTLSAASPSGPTLDSGEPDSDGAHRAPRARA